MTMVEVVEGKGGNMMRQRPATTAEVRRRRRRERHHQPRYPRQNPVAARVRVRKRPHVRLLDWPANAARLRGVWCLVVAQNSRAGVWGLFPGTQSLKETGPIRPGSIHFARYVRMVTGPAVSCRRDAPQRTRKYLRPRKMSIRLIRTRRDEICGPCRALCVFSISGR